MEEETAERQRCWSRHTSGCMLSDLLKVKAHISAGGCGVYVDLEATTEHDNTRICSAYSLRHKQKHVHGFVYVDRGLFVVAL
jgi:hypothetical protein